MPFQKGAPGRPKGTLNKRSVKFLETIQEEGFDPALAILEIYQKAKDTFDNYDTIYEALSDAKIKSGDPFPVEDKADKYLKIALDAAKEIASYCYPKLKSVEHTQVNALANMTPEQRLDAMRQAVKMLEGEIKKNEPVSGV